nr:hypothetical protein [Kibdelosporangium sp. MJ126-NF4]
MFSQARPLTPWYLDRPGGPPGTVRDRAARLTAPRPLRGRPGRPRPGHRRPR